MEPYIDPILKKYADLVAANTSIFKKVFFGDPIRIASVNIPALIISKNATRVGNFNNAQDGHEMDIVMTVVVDVRDTLNEDNAIVAGVNELYNIVEGRQADTYELKPTSLLAILRHNVELDTGKNLRTDLDTITSAEYGITVDKRAESSYAIEAQVRFTANYIQLR